jgi:hypothetical protein
MDLAATVVVDRPKAWPAGTPLSALTADPSFDAYPYHNIQIRRVEANRELRQLLQRDSSITIESEETFFKQFPGVWDSKELLRRSDDALLARVVKPLRKEKR